MNGATRFAGAAARVLRWLAVLSFLVAAGAALAWWDAGRHDWRPATAPIELREGATVSLELRPTLAKKHNVVLAFDNAASLPGPIALLWQDDAEDAKWPFDIDWSISTGGRAIASGSSDEMLNRGSWGSKSWWSNQTVFVVIGRFTPEAGRRYRFEARVRSTVPGAAEAQPHLDIRLGRYRIDLSYGVGFGQLGVLVFLTAGCLCLTAAALCDTAAGAGDAPPATSGTQPPPT